MMSPIQLHCERTLGRRRRIQFDAIHLRALCHLWPFSILRTVGIFFSGAAAAFESNWRCTFECGTFARLNEKGQKDAPGEKLPTTHSGNATETISFLSFCVVLIQSVGCAGQIRNFAEPGLHVGGERTFITL
jgi:hypothetical protein